MFTKIVRQLRWWSRPGIDVLADQYARFETAAQDMRCIRSTERTIPLPSKRVEVLFTINALDHLSHLRPICQELLRILAPGGRVFGSFNLHQPRTACEPQTLTQHSLEKHLLDHLDVRWTGAVRFDPECPYAGFSRGEAQDGIPRGPAIPWVRASKPRRMSANRAHPTLR